MSSKRTLIYNWVEERQCQPLEADNWNPDGTLCPRLHRLGHQGLLSVNATSSSMESDTTSTVSYNPAVHLSVYQPVAGKREEKLQQDLYKLAESQVKEEIALSTPPPINYTTVTKEDYVSDFTPQDMQCSRDFNEEPASYWRQNIRKITGVSPLTDTTCKSPFSRNATFSTPIETKLHEDVPIEHSLLEST